ncbi:hypothetical protein [Propionivibrio sp.]|uniref:hypothetical protein n=1 Tax=Propionivibrio sp. TaxID=2212460 RepID=UPI003BF39F88
MSLSFNADALARQIIVRHRESGHIRFALPAEICSATATAALNEALRAQSGVYRVTLHASDGKLSVLYDEHVCSVHDVARRLFSSLATLPASNENAADLPLEVVVAERLSAGVQTLETRTRQQFQHLLQRLSHYRQFRVIQARVQPVLESALTEKAITNFLNDLLAFYLIRVHWDLITQRWLREPLKFRNAWLSVFYLVFLLVRYRKTVAKK